MSKDYNRQSTQSLKLVPQPRYLSSACSSVLAEPADALCDGISGSALAVPPPKTLVSSRQTEMIRGKDVLLKKAGHSKSDTSSNVVDSKRSKDVTDKSRELRDALAREKRLQQQITSLQQMVDSLRTELDCKTQANADLEAQLKQLETQHKEELEKAAAGHLKVISDLEQKCKQLQHKENEKNNQVQRHLQIISDLEALGKQKEAEMVEMKAEKDREIAMRDTKLDRLKQQMADALKDNSRERQQQLDELSKSLEKVQEEADILRTQLKTVRRNSKDGCTNCDKMAAKMAQLQSAPTGSDKTIKELKDRVAELEKLRSVENGQSHRRSSTDLQKNRSNAKTMK